MVIRLRGRARGGHGARGPGPANRPLSPDGIASVHVGGEWEKTERQKFTLGGERYLGGTWIDITYGRPILRGREAFSGTGADTARPHTRRRQCGERAQRLDAPQELAPARHRDDDRTAGRYSLFIELRAPTQWTFIVSWAQARFAPISRKACTARSATPRKRTWCARRCGDALPYKVEQLTWAFVDMTATGGRMAILWDRTVASVPFKFGR